MKRKGASARLLFLVAVLLALASSAFHSAHRHNVQLVSDLARRVDAGRALTDSARVQEYVAYVVHNLKKPTLAELHPLAVRLYYQLNPMHPGAGDVVRWGADYRGPCGSYSRVVYAMLKSSGVRNRIMLLLDEHGRSIHTVLEVWVDGRWIVADPSSGIVFRRRDGALASREDLARDPEFLHAQADTLKGYDPSYDYDSTTLLNWRKIPVVLPAVRALLVLVLGEARVAEIVRPEIWMYPREWLALLCLLGSIVLAGEGWRRDRRARHA